MFPFYPQEWVAIKLLEGDTEITELVRTSLPETWEAINVYPDPA